MAQVQTLFRIDLVRDACFASRADHMSGNDQLMFVRQFDTIEETLDREKKELGYLSETNRETQRRSSQRGFLDAMKQIRQCAGAECVSNAWLKAFEMLQQQPDLLRSADNEQLFVFFNAELPGSFIAAVNHFLHMRYPAWKFRWLANSLRPDTKAQDVLGDRYGLWHRYPQHWLQGKAHNGDLSDPHVIETLRTQVQQCFPKRIDFYSCDLGIESADDYTLQEVRVQRAWFGAIWLAAEILRENGCAIFKCYTFLKSASRMLIRLLGFLFEQVSLVKPATSKAPNSEIYILCRGYISDPTLLDELRRCRCDIEQCRDVVGTALLFEKAMWIAAREFASRQIRAIRKFIVCQHNTDTVAQHWLSAMKIQFLPPTKRLLPKPY